MLQLEEAAKGRGALLQTGFRPFFLGASLFALLAVALWLGIYRDDWPLAALPYFHLAVNWHAHEMIFGYAMAVVAGFLLTAVRNWTGLQTAQGAKLGLLFSFWLMARIVPLVSHDAGAVLIALPDLLFEALLLYYLAVPLYRAGKWPNLIFISSKLLPILLANLVFYLGLAGLIPDGVRYGLLAGLYLILSLMFVMAKRVLPFFIEKGLGDAVRVRNHKVIDISAIFVFILFAISDLIDPYAAFTGLAAALLAVIHSARLVGWYRPGVWRQPLLWVLFLAYTWLIAGFILKVFSVTQGIPATLALHAFAYGGIGLMTVGMMARISLGHTGRNIQQPPRVLVLVFGLLSVGALTRVFVPLLMIVSYRDMIGLSQLLWISAFLLFLVAYLPIFIKPRVDGRAG